MATVIFSGNIIGQTTRVVDRGAGAAPRLIVEIRANADAMGGFGWVSMDPIPRDAFEALLIAAHVVV